MSNATMLRAGDTIVKTLTFTLAAGEQASFITLLLTRTQARSEHPTIGRARCVVLTAQNANPRSMDGAIAPAATIPAPRERFVAELRGVVPASISGGDYIPVFCLFAYADGRAATGFEIDADQRFTLAIADDADSVDPGPSITGFA